MAPGRKRLEQMEMEMQMEIGERQNSPVPFTSATDTELATEDMYSTYYLSTY